jgi:transcriptional regulator EpsA
MRLDDGTQALTQRPQWLNEPQDPAPAAGGAAGHPDRLAPLELESLLLNLDGALRVWVRHQLFSWTQGALQNLIAHELLICALCCDRRSLRYVDSFSTNPVEPAHFNELFRNDVSLVPALFEAWEKNRCQPVIFDAGSGSQYGGGALARELARMDANRIIAHGTHDTAGQVTSLFIFACRPGMAGPRQAYLAELVVPFLNAAWIRTRVNWQALPRSRGANSVEAGVVTVREREVLEWMYRGKSNIEIGMILRISPLTVKNHVQKILRKLDVLNRTQAVGKALALRILNT